MIKSNVADLIVIAEKISERFGKAWLIGNGDEYKVAFTEQERDSEINRGFDVVTAYKNGISVR